LILLGVGVFLILRNRAAEPTTKPATKPPSVEFGKTTSAGMIALLEVLVGPEAYVDGMRAGRKVEIYSGRVRIGRSRDLCDLQLYDINDNSTVSRKHATIEFDRQLNSFVIIDEESRSGTRVNDVPIEAHQRVTLKDGDVIELGYAEQQGARLRFLSPAHRVVRGALPVVETSPVPVMASHSAAQHSEERDVDFEDMPGIRTDVGHQHPPIPQPRIGTGPLGPQEACDVFLSYSRKDREVMQRIRDDLVNISISVWTDDNLTPGTPVWRQRIEKAIETAGCLIVILSPDAKQSPWVQRELDYAVTQAVPIIPLLVRGDEKSSVPLSLISAQWADLRTDYEHQISRALVVIKETLESRASSQT
jgi:pSer/pThr/pTyr-binding forkhead associated (FHA) protein